MMTTERGWAVTIADISYPLLGWIETTPVILGSDGMAERLPFERRYRLVWVGPKVWARLTTQPMPLAEATTHEGSFKAQPGGLRDRVMQLLHRDRNKIWTSAQIARELGSNSGSVSRVMRRLEQDGLVHKGETGWLHGL